MNAPEKMETIRDEWGMQVEARPGDYAGQTRTTFIRGDRYMEVVEALKGLVFRAHLLPEDQWLEDRALEVIAKAEADDD